MSNEYVGRIIAMSFPREHPEECIVTLAYETSWGNRLVPGTASLTIFRSDLSDDILRSMRTGEETTIDMAIEGPE